MRKVFKFISATKSIKFQLITFILFVLNLLILFVFCTQQTIESYVDKRMDTAYVLSARCKMSVFVEEINMSVINRLGNQVSQCR